MSLKFEVNIKGHLDRTCYKENIEYKNCLLCDDLLTIEPRILGMPPRRLWCRGAGIEGYNRKNPYFEKRFPKIKEVNKNG